MNDNIFRAQVTIRAIKSMVNGLDDVGEQLPKNPKLFAFLSESPIEEIRRLCNELDDLLEPLKHLPAAPGTPASLVQGHPTSPTSPSPTESTS